MAPPRPASTRRRATAWAQRKLPLRLTSSTWSHSASVMARNSTRGKTPALLTRIAGAPSSRATASTIASASSGPRDVALDHGTPAARRAHLAGDPLGGGAVVQVVHADVGALLRERHRDGAPDALLGARDERDLTDEPHADLRPARGPTRGPDAYSTARRRRGEAASGVRARRRLRLGRFRRRCLACYRRTGRIRGDGRSELVQARGRHPAAERHPSLRDGARLHRLARAGAPLGRFHLPGGDRHAGGGGARDPVRRLARRPARRAPHAEQRPRQLHQHAGLAQRRRPAARRAR